MKRQELITSIEKDIQDWQKRRDELELATGDTLFADHSSRLRDMARCDRIRIEFVRLLVNVRAAWPESPAG